MKRKNIIFILLIIILSMTFSSCSQSRRENEILFKDVDSMEIVFDQDKQEVYTPEENKKEIKDFIDKFNKGNSFGNIKEVTEDTKVIIHLKNDTSIVVQQ